MNLQDYKNKYSNYNTQIKQIEIERDSFIANSQNEFNELFKQKQIEDKQWFIENFDYIWNHKDYFYNHSPFKDIVIDFLTLYESTGLCSGAAFHCKKSMLFLSDLIYAWNNGYLYKDKPLIKYKKTNHNGNIKKWFSYIENNQEYTIQDDNYDDSKLEAIKFSWNNKISIWDRYKTIDILKKKDED